MNSKPSTEDACLRETQVSRELARLQHSIDSLRKLVTDLENRLTPVTRCEPNCKGETCEPLPEVVPFAENLRTASFGVIGSADRIERLLKSLEL